MHDSSADSGVRAAAASALALFAVLFVALAATESRLAVASASDDPLAARAGGPDPVLEPRWLYTGIDRACPLRIRGRTPDAVVELVLLDASDAELARAAVPAGSSEIDLGRLLPEVWTLERSAWAQLLDGGRAVGAPVVVQPMRSREVPVAEAAVNPAGIRYTRIAGWHDERVPPPGGQDGLGQGSVERAPEPLVTGIRTWVDHEVVLRTTKGAMRFRMRPDEAPNTAWNFLSLAGGGFYRDVEFHRIKPMSAAGDPFVIQAGDPTADGSGGPGYWLPMERSRLPHDFGVISMARDVDPDSAGSQFFVCLSRAGTARLDGHYVAFGELVEGAETVLAIADSELADFDAGRAVDPPRILEAVLEPAPARQPVVEVPPPTPEDATDRPAVRPRVPR